MTLFEFDNSYASLPDAFYRPCSPTPVAAPRLLAFNATLAKSLRFAAEGLDDQALARIFSGNQLLDGSQPLATVYAGHQFGGFNPQLGDGRAILLGEVVDSAGQRRDIQLKGAGRTPYSRGGDGRSPLGPVMREYLISEAMYALGVPTTRALAAVASGEMVFREQALPGAILTRVAASHIRVGTFEYFAARGDIENLRRLANYVIERHYPSVRDTNNPYLGLLDAVAGNQLGLIAQWMSIGFVHGVMNTDNVLVSGETVDYGPCAFIDEYHPQTVFSSIDRRGRYAYQMQPAICQWNMARFAESLVPLLDEQQESALAMATEVIRSMMPRYDQAWLSRMRSKLGLYTEQPADRQLVDDLLALMDANDVDFTLLFRSLCSAAADPLQATTAQLFGSGQDWLGWAQRWAARLAAEPQYSGRRMAQMRAVNPAVIPRNHRIQQAIDKATESADFSDFERLKDVLSAPYEDHPQDDHWLGPPPSGEKVCQTFCGT
ncbi:MAG: YdiU family protein [Alcanivoracaceae bacterium]|jgi:uncharacterized protein YdiU (UPF0061 family)|nr:YdiU family protein [Alcanivoracaceae bacterium]